MWVYRKVACLNLCFKRHSLSGNSWGKRTEWIFQTRGWKKKWAAINYYCYFFFTLRETCKGVILSWILTIVPQFLACETLFHCPIARKTTECVFGWLFCLDYRLFSVACCYLFCLVKCLVEVTCVYYMGISKIWKAPVPLLLLSLDLEDNVNRALRAKGHHLLRGRRHD